MNTQKLWSRVHKHTPKILYMSNSGGIWEKQIIFCRMTWLKLIVNGGIRMNKVHGTNQTCANVYYLHLIFLLCWQSKVFFFSNSREYFLYWEYSCFHNFVSLQKYHLLTACQWQAKMCFARCVESTDAMESTNKLRTKKTISLFM